MIQWLIALSLMLAFLAAMPHLLRWVKTSGGKGRMGSVALALGIAFSFLFDPAKAEAMRISPIARLAARKQGETVE